MAPPVLRVLAIEPQGRGGIWHYAYALARALADTGVEIALATTFPYEDLGRDDTVPVRRMGTHHPQTRGLLRTPRHLVQHLGKLWNLFSLVRTFRPNIVHLHGPLGKFDFFYLRLLKALGTRVVYTAHDAQPLSRRAHWLDWARYREVDAIFVHSSNGVAELIGAGIRPERITHIAHANYLHFCPDTDLTQDSAKDLLGLPRKARVILFFGTIAPYKGLDILIEAFAILHREDVNRYLIIAGEPLEDFAPYQRQIEELGVGDRVILDLNYIAFGDFPKYFASADLVALPYRRIYQSGVLQLAYGFGRPVVATGVGGIAEAIVEDATGIVVPTLEPGPLAAAIRQVLGTPAAAREMGQRARRLAESKYSWQGVAREVKEVYRPSLPLLAAGAR